MPLYEYRCNACQATFELLRPMADRALRSDGLQWSTRVVETWTVDDSLDRRCPCTSTAATPARPPSSCSAPWPTALSDLMVFNGVPGWWRRGLWMIALTGDAPVRVPLQRLPGHLRAAPPHGRPRSQI